nr:hypothetical protein GCM10025699_51840 [Microbacterium flavescens]
MGDRQRADDVDDPGESESGPGEDLGGLVGADPADLVLPAGEASGLGPPGQHLGLHDGHEIDRRRVVEPLADEAGQHVVVERDPLGRLREVGSDRHGEDGQGDGRGVDGVTGDAERPDVGDLVGDDLRCGDVGTVGRDRGGARREAGACLRGEDL